MNNMHDLQSLIDQSVATIDTPALVVDLDAMERNLLAMQDFADQHGLKLRSHAKMHKSASGVSAPRFEHALFVKSQIISMHTTAASTMQATRATRLIQACL